MSVNFLDLDDYGSAPASGDVLAIVKISDQDQDPAGSTLGIKIVDLFTTPTFTGPVIINGGLTVGALSTAAITASGAIMGSSTVSGTSLVASNTSSALVDLVVTDAALNEKWWAWANIDGTLSLSAYTDLGGSPVQAIILTRTGTAITGITIVPPIIAPNGITGNLVGNGSGGTWTGPVHGTVDGSLNGNVNGNISGSTVAMTAGITTSGATGGGLGFAVGAGGAITQLTNRSTAVTLNTMCGQITTDTTALTGLASFTVNNTNVLANDNVIVTLASGSSLTAGATVVTVTGVSANSFKISVNTTGGSETGALVLKFAILRTVIS